MPLTKDALAAAVTPQAFMAWLELEPGALFPPGPQSQHCPLACFIRDAVLPGWVVTFVQVTSHIICVESVFIDSPVWARDFVRRYDRVCPGNRATRFAALRIMQSFQENGQLPVESEKGPPFPVLVESEKGPPLG